MAVWAAGGLPWCWPCILLINTILVFGLMKLDMKFEAKLSKKKFEEGFAKLPSPIGPSKTAKLYGERLTLPENGDILKGIKNKL